MATAHPNLPTVIWKIAVSAPRPAGHLPGVEQRLGGDPSPKRRSCIPREVYTTLPNYGLLGDRGEALPGLLIAQDVSHFHDVINRTKSMDEANRKKQQLEKAKPDTSSKEPTT